MGKLVPDSRGVKHPHFAFSFKEGKTLHTAKQIGDVKFSGEDARVLMAHESELQGSGAGPLFYRVLQGDLLVPHHNDRSTQILCELNDVTLIHDAEHHGLSELRAAELLFTSHNEISKFYRDPKKTKDDVEELEKWVETYYQSNILLFPVDKAFTPYKAKLLVFPRLLRAGNIISLFEHLTEATENSNHGVNALYSTHSMRDGGSTEYNVTSEFEDLFHSFGKSQRLAHSRLMPERDSASTTLANLLTEPPQPGASRTMYLDICRQPLPTLKLDLGKKENVFTGMKFYFIHNFGNVPSFVFSGKLIKKVTKVSLERVVNKLDGLVLTDSVFDTLSEKYSELQQCYVVLQARRSLFFLVWIHLMQCDIFLMHFGIHIMQYY